MKIVLVLAALVAVTLGAPAEAPKAPIPILQYDEQRDNFGQFSLSYKTGDGTIVTRQGALKPTPDGKDHVLIQSGSQTWTAPDGKIFKLTWTGDEEGYRAEGDHLPVAPAVPDAPASAALA